jgi:uncharacterized protein DUF4136
MFSTLGHGIVAVSLLAGAMAAGCAPIQVNSYAEPGVAFHFRTYTWAPEDSVSTGDPRLDNNPFFSDRVRESVDRELAARGFEKTASGTPDVLLHYHASITQELEIKAAATDRFEHCPNCGTSVYDAGTLVIDLVDAHTSRLVWRGWAEKVNAVIDNQDWMEAIIDLTVAQIMKRLPPRS